MDLPNNTPSPVFRAATGGFIALVVPDLNEAAQWYAQKLGLRIVKNTTRPDGKAAVTILQANGFTVELLWLVDAMPLLHVASQLNGPQDIHGILKAGIFVDDLDATHAALQLREVHMAFEIFFDLSMDCRMFAIRDNNGNILQFFGK